MAPAAVNLGGAHQRLLPEAVPLRFFGTAVLAHGLAWAALIATAADVPFYRGGPSGVAATIHLLTVGVLLSSAIAASLQMLPVALGRPAPAPAACHAVFALLLLGGASLIAGFALAETGMLVLGAGVLAAAVALYAHALVRLLAGASGLALVRQHVMAALACLGFGVLAAVLLAVDYRAAILPDHGALALAHMLLLAFGFLGLLALGLSQVLVPMFAVAEAPTEGRMAQLAFALALAALATALVGLAAGLTPLLAPAAVLGLAAAGCHVAQMERLLARRIRRRMGGEFVLIRLSWAMLPLALLLACGLALDLLPDTAPALFGFCALFGWLLSLVLGVQQRILPFLASMHAVRARARPLAPAKLVNERSLVLHRWCHGAALAAVGLGIALAEPAAIRAGGAVGTLGAIAYGAFAATVLRRARHHLATSAPPARSPAR